MIPAFIIKLVGEKLAGPLFFGGLGLLVIVALFGLARCGRDDTAQRQAEQTTRSGAAITHAAEDSLATYGSAVAAEAASAGRVAADNKEITHAPDRDAQRRIVLERVCQTAGHRNDPACKLRAAAAP